MSAMCSCKDAEHLTPCDARLQRRRGRCSRCRWLHPLGIRPSHQPRCVDCGKPTRDHHARRCHECYLLRPTGRTVEERFWDQVALRSEGRPRLGRCWEWTGFIQPNGYGRAHREGRGLPAHRLSWELVVGRIPTGLIVLHRCDNRACVRPSHLSLGTSVDNMADMVAKGRSSRGERAATAKLTEDNVRDIRRRAEAGETRRALGAEFGVSTTTISLVRRRKVWRHVA